MPTYDYLCDNCGHRFEKFQSITAGALKKCPECGQMRLKRLIGTGAAVIFKGSGFYETDYRSKSYTDSAKKEKKSDSDSSDTKKGDAKPEKKDTKKVAETTSTPKADK